ncbi:hypothetical protein EQP49_00035 [Yersinia sp. 2105 StPb PI]|nr:hypothetical protein CBW53_15955 [Yersinia frederiksenii]RXA97971.1 hypothetical protein EQP49_00035 [Yersinia sp. 2105 StPb PI]CNI99263.1 Uncharacterised protein [Yersinia frederiksenii]
MDKHIEDLKQYDTENRLEEIMSTNHYGVHVHAMTKEALHSKSAIAVELAWRDLQISNLLAKLEAAQKLAQYYLEQRDAAEQVSAAALRDWSKEGQRAEAAEARLLVPVKLSLSTVLSRAHAVERIIAAGYPVEGDE